MHPGLAIAESLNGYHFHPGMAINASRDGDRCIVIGDRTPLDCVEAFRDAFRDGN